MTHSQGDCKMPPHVLDMQVDHGPTLYNTDPDGVPLSKLGMGTLKESTQLSLEGKAPPSTLLLLTT